MGKSDSQGAGKTGLSFNEGAEGSLLEFSFLFGLAKVVKRGVHGGVKC